MKTKSSVLPFKQPGHFFHKRATIKVDRSDYLDAVGFLHKALELDPDNSEYLLDLADVYSRMYCFEESNQILASVIRRGQTSPECFFGMGCNFYAMRQFSNAREALLTYQRMDPEGEYVETADEILDDLDDFEDSPLPPELSALTYRGKQALDDGDYHKAVKLFQKALAQDESLLFVQNNLALSYYCLKQMDLAIETTAQVLAEDPDNLHANCNMALFLSEEGEKQHAKPYVEHLMTLSAEDPDDLYKLSLTLCEIGHDQEAITRLKELLFYRPYDKRALHYHAVASYNLGRYKEAQKLWDKVRRIDPDSPVPPYYMQVAAAALDGEDIPGRLHYYYQLPPDEIRSRLSQFYDMLTGSQEQVRRRFDADNGFRQLIRWGLSVADEGFQRTTLQLLSFIGGHEAEEILRDFLLYPTSDSLKREGMGALKAMGAKEPFIAYMGDSVVEVRVSVFETDFPMTHHQQTVLRLAAEAMPNYLGEGMPAREDAAKEMMGIWTRYLQSVQNVRINRPPNWAAALSLVYMERHDIPISHYELAHYFDVPMRTLKDYTQRIRSALELSEEEEHDLPSL